MVLIVEPMAEDIETAFWRPRGCVVEPARQLRNEDLLAYTRIGARVPDPGRDVPPRNGHCCPHQGPPHADGLPPDPGPPIATAGSTLSSPSGFATTSSLSASLSPE